MIVPYGHVLTLAAIIFCLGLVCVVARRNLVMVLIGVEIMLNGAAIAFMGSGLLQQRLEGQAFVLFILGIAATEVSVGLVLVLHAYRRSGSVDPDTYNVLKG
jgi:NADH-quinone oxidoreductase subunit K